MKAGIIGLEGVGKRTLFRLLTRAAGTGTGREEQYGVLKVPDDKLPVLTRIHDSRKTTYATIELVLIPSLAKDRRDKIDLSSLRAVDVLVHVVRAFEDPSVPHPEGSVDPVRDLEVLELELTLSDLGVVERRLERIEADVKKGRKGDAGEIPLLQRARDALAEGRSLRTSLAHEELDALRGYALLTAKPMLVVVNVGENEAATSDLPDRMGLSRFQAEGSFAFVGVSAKIEAELAELSADEATAFRNDMGLNESVVARIVRSTFELMKLVTFYTAGDPESRAWVVPRNTKAVEAAGAIHSDMARGFIRAEVVPYGILVREGSWSACRDKGLLRLEGKEYPIAEADVVLFRFNV